MIEAALNAGALAAKLAGAGGGGTIMLLTYEPDRIAAALRAAGASRILRPAPSAGVRVEQGSGFGVEASGKTTSTYAPHGLE